MQKGRLKIGILAKSNDTQLNGRVWSESDSIIFTCSSRVLALSRKSTFYIKPKTRINNNAKVTETYASIFRSCLGINSDAELHGRVIRPRFGLSSRI